MTQTYKVILQPKGLQFTAQADEDLVNAAAKAGIRIRKSCENGVCEVCKAKLIAGVAKTRQGLVTPDSIAQSIFLPCVASADSDLILELDNVLGPGEIPLQHIAFQIAEVEPMSEDVYRIELMAPAGKLPDYHAGQYLELLIDGGEYPFTIASAPNGRSLELHLGVSSDNPNSSMILNHLKSHPTVRARLPKGDVWLQSDNLHDPLVFVVAGTGFSQAKAMIEEQLRHQHSALYVYWINRDVSGFYSSVAAQWAEQGLIRYRQMTPENPECEFYTPEPVEHLIQQDVMDLKHIRVIACGGPNFVYSVLDGLEKLGFHDQQMRSDVFAYAPRPEKPAL